jgi:hypothetical protein
MEQVKQTAVEWLFIQLYENFEMKGDGREMDVILEQAKAMEKEQIVNAYNDCEWTGDHEDGEDYYNETFKSE